eukprot:TRINITY_DN27806_c0_g1_i1.p1 TRINITY_DN27806_c0_g1~~TRINITY_DN27806_c0_g1_i1.p1  ORF type:complete len:475 (-),score=38.07 TRINITY_DN27806_c0_g1_i1:48-1397(-)
MSVTSEFSQCPTEQDLSSLIFCVRQLKLAIYAQEMELSKKKLHWADHRDEIHRLTTPFPDWTASESTWSDDDSTMDDWPAVPPQELTDAKLQTADSDTGARLRHAWARYWLSPIPTSNESMSTPEVAVQQVLERLRTKTDINKSHTVNERTPQSEIEIPAALRAQAAALKGGQHEEAPTQAPADDEDWPWPEPPEFKMWECPHCGDDQLGIPHNHTEQGLVVDTAALLASGAQRGRHHTITVPTKHAAQIIAQLHPPVQLPSESVFDHWDRQCATQDWFISAVETNPVFRLPPQGNKLFMLGFAHQVPSLSGQCQFFIKIHEFVATLRIGFACTCESFDTHLSPMHGYHVFRQRDSGCANAYGIEFVGRKGEVFGCHLGKHPTGRQCVWFTERNGGLVGQPMMVHVNDHTQKFNLMPCLCMQTGKIEASMTSFRLREQLQAVMNNNSTP